MVSCEQKHFEKDDEEAYFKRKAAARNDIAEEIRLADQSKRRALFKITEERRETERRHSGDTQGEDLKISDTKSISSETHDSIKTKDLCSFDEEDFSISGISTIKGGDESSSEIENKMSQNIHDDLDSDTELSQFQIMQAFLLAEEASLKGESEFKTCEKSIYDLNNVKVSSDVFEDENKMVRSPKFILSLINRRWFESN